MKFSNLIDLIQVFSNEYSIPGNNILILGYYNPGIKKIFEFINCETFFVSDTDTSFEFIYPYTDLPFEENTFDAIINFTNEINFKYLKKDGVMLVKGEILNAREYYQLGAQEIFTVLTPD